MSPQPLKTTPSVTVILPIKGHPVLLEDALASVVREMEASPVIDHVIVIDDGCTYAETRETLRIWQAYLGERLTLRHFKNGGLSAARNRGVALAFERNPALDAIFLLDADNTLAVGASQTMEVLLRSAPQSDWFYPRFDFFGQDAHYASEAAPSLLFHAFANHSEAGSLVRARVFEAGLRFDEAMRGGYEDWDFWLQAQGAGFQGALAERPLLNYRKRPVSMLSGSHDRDAELRRYMEKKHDWLFHPRRLVALEAERFARFALLDGETEEVLLFTDPEQVERLSFDAYERQLFAALSEGLSNYAPSYLVIVRGGLLKELRARKLEQSFFWQVQRNLVHKGGKVDQFYFLPSSDATEVIENYHPGWGHRPDGMSFDLTQLKELLNSDIAKIRSLDGDAPDLALSHWAMRIAHADWLSPDQAPASEIARTALLRLKRSRYIGALSQQWEWRARGGAASRDLASYIPRKFAAEGVLLPQVKVAGRREIAFTLPIVDFGGVEKVAASLARECAAAGWHCHLVLIGKSRLRIESWMQAAFHAIHILPDVRASDWSGPEFLGTNEPSWGNEAERADLIALLSGMDVVINAHSAVVHKVADQLRRMGVIMITHEHLVERSTVGRPYGAPILALAYEAAYARVLTCSTALAQWLHREGMPEEKLMPVVNAPGYPMTRDEQSAALARRISPQEDRPLRVLYLGRFDRQKGMDRLQRIYHGVAQVEQGIELHAIGGGILNEPSALGLPARTKVSPPARSPAALTEALVQADILVLPSYYEGLPLVVLEAKRLGVVVIATQAGAIDEAIETGKTGIIVPQEGCEMAMIEQILALHHDRALLAQMSSAASEAWRDWTMASAELRAWLDLQVPV